MGPDLFHVYGGHIVSATLLGFILEATKYFRGGMLVTLLP